MERRLLFSLATLLALPASATHAAERIVSVDGALTEIVYAIGADTMLVGVDTTSQYPPQTSELPNVGYKRQLSAEGILALAPDLILATEDAGPPAVLEQIRDVGIEIAMIPSAPTATGLKAKVRAVAEALERTPQGEALAAAEVSHFEARSYPTLSGGERQRVQLARVLAQIWEPPAGDKSRYLLLDEPTSSLDLTHQHATLRLARRFSRQGVGVLAVLHDLNLAAEYADRIALLRGGRLQTIGVPAEVLTPETIGRAFDMPVMVIPHPTLGCPLVVPTLV